MITVIKQRTPINQIIQIRENCSSESMLKVVPISPAQPAYNVDTLTRIAHADPYQSVEMGITLGTY